MMDEWQTVHSAASDLGLHCLLRPDSGVILELSHREKFCEDFRISGRSFGPNFLVSLYILCILLLPQLKIGRSQPD